MKKKLAVVTFLAAVLFSASIQAQSESSVTMKELRDKKAMKFTIPAKKFTLQISGIKANEKIEIVYDQNPENPVLGDKAGNARIYVLDGLLDDIEPGKELTFIVRDGNTENPIHSFTLAGASGVIDPDPTATTTKPGNNNTGIDAGDLPIAFYDAQVLYNEIRQSGSNEVKGEVLKKYPQADIDKNPFFKEFEKINKDVLKNSKPAAQAIGAGFLASLGGIDVTKYVQATADFLRDRIKEELAIAFINRFRETIESIPELKALLPKTYNVFASSDPFKVASLGQTYKTAFKEDLESFVTNFEILVDTNEKFKNLRENQAFTAFRIAYHVIDMSANDFHPIDIFEFLDARFGLDASVQREKDINKYVSLLNLLSQHLRKKEIIANNAKDGWVSLEDVKKFNPNAILLFWGLVYQDNKDVFDKITIKNVSLGEHILKGSASVQVYLRQFVVLVNNIDERIREFNALIEKIKNEVEAAKEMAIKDFVANADKLVDITDFIFRLPYFKNELGTEFFTSEYYTKWRPVIFDVIETVKGVYAKDYGKIAVNATSLISHLTGVEKETVFSPVFLENFTFYSNFIVDVINADSANDVKAVLNRYAEPVGSYQVKRKTKFSVSVNAYPGLYVGVESYKGTQNKTFGVTAPIGFSLNWGVKNKKNKDWSYSIFLNAVDIAAALSYRWSNDTLDLPETITLAQIFSPGAFFVVGFPNAPISLKLGVQYAPQLRSITKDGNTINDAGAVRFGISGTVDIPIFNFYNRSRLKHNK